MTTGELKKKDPMALSNDKRAALVRQLINNGRASAPQKLRRQVNPYLTLENRSLLMLFATGELEAVDAVSIGTLSDLLLAKSNEVKERTSIARLDHDLPVFSSVRTLASGRIGSFILPRFYTQIYADRPGLVDLVDRTRRVARLLGARCVSLTGLLASATDYGNQCSVDPELPPVTTGHATTASAVVLTLRGLLRLVGRELSREAVGYIGLGSVGSSALRLMLSVLPHPRSLSICDVYQKREAVAELIATVRHTHNFAGPISFHQSRGPVPDSFYENTVIVGATNVPDVIEVSRLRPGTLLIDDSDPHCFNVDEAFRRLEEGSILFSEGGAIRSPDPVKQLLFVPEDLTDIIPTPTEESSWNITGCVLSALLSAKHAYPTTRGWVKPEDALTNYRGLVGAGFAAAPPHCGTRTLPQSAVNSFRDRFGNAEIT
jgi:hypothetical protein